MSKFGMYVMLTARSGRRDALIAQLLDAVALLRRDLRCELCIVNTAAADADTVWVTEVWRSRADFRAVQADPAVAAVVACFAALLACPPEIVELLSLGGKGLADVA